MKAIQSRTRLLTAAVLLIGLVAITGEISFICLCVSGMLLADAHWVNGFELLGVGLVVSFVMVICMLSVERLVEHPLSQNQRGMQ